MRTANLLSDIRKTIAQGGPKVEEYQAFNVCINELGQLIRTNKISEAELESIRTGCRFLDDPNSIMGHILQKPYGYAGDFAIIDRLYTYDHSEAHRCWDDFALQNAAAKAVRNRKQYFKEQLKRRLNSNSRLLNIASGPARDVYELLHENPLLRPGITCVEMDSKAIAHARTLNDAFLDQISFINKNIFRFDTAEKYDVIWSAGLFDYFDDRAFVLLLQRFNNWIDKGGEIIIGNFNQDCNPSRDYMELFGDWKLRHRSAEELMELACRAGFDAANVFVGSEPEQVNLFLHIRK